MVHAASRRCCRAIDAIDEHVDISHNAPIFLDISIISVKRDLPDVEANCRNVEKRAMNGTRRTRVGVGEDDSRTRVS